MEPMEAPLGAAVHDIDLSRPLGDADFRTIEQALGLGTLRNRFVKAQEGRATDGSPP
jgi:hypothetical protein